MVITLKSETLIVTSVFKKTSAKMFKNLQVGDKIELSVPVRYAGANRGQTYSTYITVRNLATDEVVSKSFNELPKFLDIFEFEGAD